MTGTFDGKPSAPARQRRPAKAVAPPRDVDADAIPALAAQQIADLTEGKAALESRIAELEGMLNEARSAFATLGSATDKARRTAAIANDQRDWLIGFSRALLDKLVGIQLAANQINLSQANEYVASETASANAQLDRITAKHSPPADAAANDGAAP